MAYELRAKHAAVSRVLPGGVIGNTPAFGAEVPGSSPGWAEIARGILHDEKYGSRHISGGKKHENAFEFFQGAA